MPKGQYDRTKTKEQRAAEKAAAKAAAKATKPDKNNGRVKAIKKSVEKAAAAKAEQDQKPKRQYTRRTDKNETKDTSVLPAVDIVAIIGACHTSINEASKGLAELIKVAVRVPQTLLDKHFQVAEKYTDAINQIYEIYIKKNINIESASVEAEPETEEEEAEDPPLPQPVASGLPLPIPGFPPPPIPTP